MKGLERFRPMPEEKLKPEEGKIKIERLAPQDLIENSSDENIKRYIESLLRETEEEIPAVTAVLEAKPGEAVTRREALVDIVMRTTRVRVDGLKKGYTTPQAFEQGVKEAILKQIEKYRTS